MYSSDQTHWNFTSAAEILLGKRAPEAASAIGWLLQPNQLLRGHRQRRTSQPYLQPVETPGQILDSFAWHILAENDDAETPNVTRFMRKSLRD